MSRLIKNRFSFWILSLILLIGLLFVTPNTLDRLDSYQKIFVPYIKSNLGYYFIFLLVIVLFIGLLIKRNCKTWIDQFGIIMFFRMIWIIVATIINSSSISGNIVLPILEFLIYITFFMLDLRKKTLLKILKLFTLLIALETIYSGLLVIREVGYLNLAYKSMLNLPIGSSNALGIYLVAGALLYILSDEKYKNRLLGITIMILAIFFTKSRSAILILVTTLVFYNYSKYKKHLSLKININILFLILIIISISLMFSQQILEFFLGYSDLVTSGGFFNKISSGRMGVISTYSKLIENNPFLGYGVYYDYSLIHTRPHNIIINILYQLGIPMGLFFIFYLINKIRKIWKENPDNILTYLIISIFLSAFFEIGLLDSQLPDIIFFGLLGFMSKNRSNKKDVKYV